MSSTEGLRQRSKGKSTSHASVDTPPSETKSKDNKQDKASDEEPLNEKESQNQPRKARRGPFVRGVTLAKFGVAFAILLYIHLMVEEMPFFSLSAIATEITATHSQTWALTTNLLPRGCALAILFPLGAGLLLSTLFSLVMLDESHWKPKPAMLVMLPVFLAGTWLLMMGTTWMLTMTPMNSWASVWALPAITAHEVLAPPRREADRRTRARAHRRPRAGAQAQAPCASAGASRICRRGSCGAWCSPGRGGCRGPRRGTTPTPPWMSSW